MIDNGLSKLRKYVRLASEIDYRVQPPHTPVQINDVDKITPEIIMNTIMTVRDELQADWIILENKTITYRKDKQEQISKLMRTNAIVQKQLLEIEKTLQTLSQAVTNLQTQKAPISFSTQDVCYQQPQQEANGGHTQGIYRKASNTQKTETPVTPTPVSRTPTAHNPYINHDRDCR